ncbi:unnamed protein product [Bursaphelenchus xylophilus]|uniref:(pine wood nematode) hypothetical protein n=1 Tax=Bursaphelenchus xylophilus TaxID=6326 RepID=A0A1I7S9K9_BURXY|nr:unnamed protein product [Bursaphelenchus xylophilus]CAG9131948.1 unnamed protein product [Bursaphelenchus xylophilus]
MWSLKVLCVVFVAILCSVSAAPKPKPDPQLSYNDGSLSGSILSPWGGNMPGSYSSPYGSFANSYSTYGRYSNAAGFL